MFDIDDITTCLQAFEAPRVDVRGRRQAAVAVVLNERSASETEVLFIERATRVGDPWSGHMAFPGGRRDPEDPSSRAVAERETIEEVGLPLVGADYVGPLADVLGNPRVETELVISAHVYRLADSSPPPLVVEPAEVETAFWFPVGDLLDPDRHVDFTMPHMKGVRFPGIEVGEPGRHVVWGLTYRFLDIFFEALGSPLPNRWSDVQRADALAEIE